MHDIKIPEARSKKPTEFEITSVMAAASEVKVHEPSEKVKVKFKKFVHLVATHDFEGVMDENADEDVIISTNLLTDLANAHEQQEEPKDKKTPLFFIVGIVLGIVITFLILR